LLGREDQYVWHKGRPLWFYELSQHFYENQNVLKVKIVKNLKDSLRIIIFHRNANSIRQLKESFEERYNFAYNSNYVLELVEFNNTQYK
jgi:hypothetical protein